MTRGISGLLLGGLLVVLIGAFAACDSGGGSALTLEEYFEEVQALDAEFESTLADVEAGFGELDDSSSVDDVVNLLGKEVDVIEDFVAGLDGLNAPEEAKDVHEEATSAGRAVVQAFRDAIAENSDAESVEDFFRPFESGELDPVFKRFEEACLDAEQLATDNGVTIDLNCEAE